MLTILQSLLAFAVTMLGMATVVTILLEVVARLTRRRGRVFAHMVGIVFRKEIVPRLKIEEQLRRRHGTDTKTVEAELIKLSKAFQDEIRKSPYSPETDPNPISRLSALFRWLGPDVSHKMSRDEFVRRLARTETGRDLYLQATGRIEEVVDKLSLRYDETAAAAREYITNSSMVLSLLIGIGLALVANVDGYRILRFYADNPDVAAAVGAKADEYLDAYDEARKKLDATLKELSKTPADGEPAPENARAEARKEIENVKKDLEKAKDTVMKIKGEGVPVGFAYFPHCRYIGPSDAGSVATGWPECADARDRKADLDHMAGRYITWLLSVLVTGMLIGLGGPFWYDAVRGLMRATQMMRGKTPIGEESETKDKADEKPRTTTKIFTDHIEQPAGPQQPPGPLWRPKALPATPATPGTGGQK